MKYIHILILVICFGIFFGGVTLTEAATLSFSPMTVKVTAGQTFRVNVMADPQSSTGYTVKANMTFPADYLSLKSWTFDDRWLPLRQPGYEMTDNTNGKAVRTGGFSNGFGAPTKFGTVVFVAKKNGTVVLNFASDSIILDRDNKNIYKVGQQGTIIITPTSVVSTPIPVVPPVVKKPLLDIRLVTENIEVYRLSDLRPQLVFSNYGEIPAEVHVNFDVLNDEGVVLYTKKIDTTVETSSLYISNLDDISLIPGRYLLRVTTEYGDSIIDEFREPFTILSSEERPSKLWWLLLILPFIIMLWIMYREE